MNAFFSGSPIHRHNRQPAAASSGHPAGRIRWLGLIGLMLTAWLLSQPAAWAQRPPMRPTTPEQEDAKKIESEMNRMRFSVSQMLRSGEITDRPQFEKFYTLRVDLFKHPANLTDLPKIRSEIKRELRQIGSAPDKKGLATLNALLLFNFENLAFEQPEDKVHPAVRFNAMLMIGDLNSQELNQGGQGTVQAMPEALPVLLKGATAADLSDAVRVAALLGVLRHAEVGIADKQMESQVMSAMSTLLAEKQPPADRSPEAHVWMRRRAADVLGAMHRLNPTQGGKTAREALIAAVSDAENPLPLRCNAAEALGRFSFPAPGPDPALVLTLGNLALEASKNETSRRGLKHCLHSILVGLKGPDNQPADQPVGMVAGLTGPQKKLGDEIQAQLASLLVVVDKVADDAQLQDAVTPAAEKLSEIIKAGGRPAAGAS